MYFRCYSRQKKLLFKVPHKHTGLLWNKPILERLVVEGMQAMQAWQIYLSESQEAYL